VFSLQLQVYLNGRVWLAHTLASHGIRFTEQGKALLRRKDLRRTRNSIDRFVSLDWAARRTRCDRITNPHLADLLSPHTGEFAERHHCRRLTPDRLIGKMP